MIPNVAASLVIRFELAKQIAISAGKITLDYFQQDSLEVEHKGDGTPLTIADQKSELHLRDEIAKAFPADGIVGEEFGEQTGTTGFRWILDPIDGTKSFISGVPLYGTMVGIELNGKSVIGSVYFPGLDEGIYAVQGGGAWAFRGDAPPYQARVNSKADVAKSVFATSEAVTFQERSAGEVYQQLTEQFYFARTWGDVYGYFLVATGRIELMIDPILSIWDAAAVQPIIEEAGGKFTDWAGQQRCDAGEAIGSNGRIHDAVLDITRKFAGNF